jgi:hypothetical protein
VSDESTWRRNFGKYQLLGPSEVKTNMKTFVIDPANRTKAYASSEVARLRSNGAQFATQKDFASVSADWPMVRLVSIWNQLPGVKPVRKFTDRRTALRRVWSTIQVLEPGTGTKSDLVIGLLQRRSGATLKEIMAATGWQAHSVRGFISAQMSKKLGFQVTSFKRTGERVYRARKKSL